MIAGVQPSTLADLPADHRDLLVRRLRINTAIRLGIALLLGLGAWVAAPAGILPRASALPLSLLGLLVAVYGGVLWAVGRHFQHVLSIAGVSPLRWVMVVAVLLDLLVLAATISLLGGVRSPYQPFYLIHVTLSCIVLAPRAAVGVTAAAFLLVCAQVTMEWAGPPAPDLLPALAGAGPLSTREALEILGVYATLFTGVDFLVISLVEWLRRTETELRVRNRHLDRLSRLRRDFLHVAVHNLRSPLGASLMHVDNLRGGLAGPLNDRQAEWLQRIEERLSSLLRLLQDMQTLGELETDVLADRAETVEVNPLVGELVADYGYEAEPRGIRLRWRPGEDVPPVRGVPRLIREAVRNYLSNAVKYSPEATAVEVVTGTEEVGEGRRWVRIAVEDRGPGIADEARDRLFREFTRLPAPGDGRRPPGSGMGLSIVRRIAEVHGGRVGVEPRAGGGSVFWLLLPPTEVDGRPAESEGGTAAGVRPTGDSSPGPGGGPRAGRASGAPR